MPGQHRAGEVVEAPRTRLAAIPLPSALRVVTPVSGNREAVTPGTAYAIGPAMLAHQCEALGVVQKTREVNQIGCNHDDEAPRASRTAARASAITSDALRTRYPDPPPRNPIRASPVCRSRAVDCPHGQSLARSAAFVRALEQRRHALSRLGEGGRLPAAVRRRLGRARHGIRDRGRHHRQGPSPRTGRKRGTSRQAIGRSKGGLTPKILAPTDALGNLVRFVLLPGQRFDTVGVPPLIDGVSFGALLADTAFDSNEIIADLNERGAKVVIAQHPRRTTL